MRITACLAACAVLGVTVPAAAFDGTDIANLARANVGDGACSTNSAGGTAYESSCTGNGGEPEYWCADFAMWVWASVGADVSKLDAAAGSFYVYGQDNGTLSDTPAVGDAVVFDYQGGGVADHVALVTQVNGDGTIETVSGDWDGDNGTEAQFASTSKVVHNTPAYASTVGSSPAVMGMTISGFVAPLGLASAASYGATYVSQSFPLATTALQMTTGQTIPSYIEMKNSGTKAWDGNTHLGTTQPRDRTSVFADDTWLSPDRPSGVTGTVAVGGTYKFTFDLHAPSTPGTYYEYFNLVEEGVAWFSDPGQGGPPDDDLEVQIVVVAGPESADGGADEDAGGGSSGDDAGKPVGAAHDSGTAQREAGPPPAPSDDAGSWDGATAPPGAGGGCATAPNPAGFGLGWLTVAAALAGAARARRPRAGLDRRRPRRVASHSASR